MKALELALNRKSFCSYILVKQTSERKLPDKRYESGVLPVQLRDSFFRVAGKRGIDRNSWQLPEGF